jgi:hypothetical protein
MMGRVYTKGWEVSVDNRISANATAIAGLAVKRLDLTIASNAWVLNQTSNKYEYTGSNTNITADTYIDIIMDDTNAEKFVDGAVTSASGSFTIATTTAPETSVSMTLILIETTDVTPAGD